MKQKKCLRIKYAEFYNENYTIAPDNYEFTLSYLFQSHDHVFREATKKIKHRMINVKVGHARQKNISKSNLNYLNTKLHLSQKTCLISILNVVTTKKPLAPYYSKLISCKTNEHIENQLC